MLLLRLLYNICRVLGVEPKILQLHADRCATDELHSHTKALMLVMLQKVT